MPTFATPSSSTGGSSAGSRTLTSVQTTRLRAPSSRLPTLSGDEFSTGPFGKCRRSFTRTRSNITTSAAADKDGVEEQDGLESSDTAMGRVGSPPSESSTPLDAIQDDHSDLESPFESLIGDDQSFAHDDCGLAAEFEAMRQAHESSSAIASAFKALENEKIRFEEENRILRVQLDMANKRLNRAEEEIADLRGENQRLLAQDPYGYLAGIPNTEGHGRPIP